jgi:DNA repair protein RecO (recombination protein O)
MKSVAAQPAFVLHRYDWAESSLIVDLFTREAGRVAVAARGAKRPTSQLRAVLMPFQRIQVGFARPRENSSAEIHNLRSAEWGGGLPIRGGEALLAGFYLNELVMKLLPREDPHPVLWDAYAATLPGLGAADEAAALRAFELVLLVETGHLPDLSRCTTTLDPLQGTRRYALRSEVGLVPARDDDPAALGGTAWTGLHAALAVRDLTALRAACARAGPALRKQLRELLAYHLGGIPLRTRDVVRELQPLLTGR